MVYVNETPTAKFSSFQSAFKRRVDLPKRLVALHAMEFARHPMMALNRAALYLRHKKEISGFDSVEFDRRGYLDVTEAIAPAVSAVVARWRPRCDDELARQGSDCPRSPFPLEELLNDTTIRALIFHPFIIKTTSAYLVKYLFLPV